MLHLILVRVLLLLLLLMVIVVVAVVWRMVVVMMVHVHESGVAELVLEAYVLDELLVVEPLDQVDGDLLQLGAHDQRHLLEQAAHVRMAHHVLASVVAAGRRREAHRVARYWRGRRRRLHQTAIGRRGRCGNYRR